MIELVDTAGTDSPGSSIETQSQAFREEQLARADLVLVCHPADSVETYLEEPKRALPILRVLTKVDLGGGEKRDILGTSSLTREGLGELERAIYRELSSSSREGGAVLETSVRCRDSLAQASEALQSASTALQRGLGDELVAVDLRETLNELGRVVGSVFTDDILDHIFSRFCIGK